MIFDSSTPVVMRYAVSYIDEEQACKNFESEVAKLSFDQVKKQARKVWNDELGKIIVEGGSEADGSRQRISQYQNNLPPWVA